jgi:hypothetical protein
MTRISSLPREPSLLSPRTADYVAALIRQGDDFDYSKWLHEVQEKEVGAKRDQAARTSDDSVRRERDNRSNMPERRATWPDPKLPLKTRTSPIPIAIWQSHHRTTGDTPGGRLRRRLERIRDALADFQASRARDAVYGYLQAVLAIVEHYKVRRKTSRLLQHAFKFANLPLDKNADLFTAVIRCTCEHEIDSKTISKWARALRYVAHSKPPKMRVEAFMKSVGGINACADRYAKRLGKRLS